MSKVSGARGHVRPIPCPPLLYFLYKQFKASLTCAFFHNFPVYGMKHNMLYEIPYLYDMKFNNILYKMQYTWCEIPYTNIV